MKAEDLRIGNLILDFDNEVCEVLELHKGTFETTINGYKVDDKYVRQFKPIPLTEEWLLRFGIRKIGSYFQLKTFCVYLRRGDSKYVFRHCVKTFELKYVHQLQSLYFALTGEELILKQDEL